MRKKKQLGLVCEWPTSGCMLQQMQQSLGTCSEKLLINLEHVTFLRTIHGSEHSSVSGRGGSNLVSKQADGSDNSISTLSVHNTLARSLARSLPSSPRLVLLIEESRGRGRGEREERERERERWRLCDSPNAMLACSLPSHHACTPYPYAVSIRATAVALVVVVIVVVFPVISGLPSRP